MLSHWRFGTGKMCNSKNKKHCSEQVTSKSVWCWHQALEKPLMIKVGLHPLIRKTAWLMSPQLGSAWQGHSASYHPLGRVTLRVGRAEPYLIWATATLPTPSDYRDPVSLRVGHLRPIPEPPSDLMNQKLLEKGPGLPFYYAPLATPIPTASWAPQF